MSGRPSARPSARAGSPGSRGPIDAFLRTWQGWVILTLVASQLLIPLHYYIAHRDPHDERFAWRMFSPMRMAQCRPAFTLDRKPVALAEQFHEAWIETAKRGRFRVIEAMAASLCERNPGSEVVVTVTCTYVGRKDPVEYGGWNMCNVPTL